MISVVAYVILVMCVTGLSPARWSQIPPWRPSPTMPCCSCGEASPTHVPLRLVLGPTPHPHRRALNRSGRRTRASPGAANSTSTFPKALKYG